MAGLESFHLKSQALDAVAKASEAVQAALEEVRPALTALSSEDRAEFRRWLLEVINSIGPSEPTPQSGGDSSPPRLPGAFEAFLALLRDHPSGLRMREIEDRLEGKFQTTSPEWRNMLQSAATKLTRRGKVIRGEDRRYRLAPEGNTRLTRTADTRSNASARREPAYRQIVRLLDKVKRPLSLAEIVDQLKIPEGSIKSALYTRTAGYFRRLDVDGEIRWEINPLTRKELVDNGVIH